MDGVTDTPHGTVLVVDDEPNRRGGRAHPASVLRPADGGQQPSWRAMTICCTSSVPSPMVRILASR